MFFPTALEASNQLLIVASYFIFLASIAGKCTYSMISKHKTCLLYRRNEGHLKSFFRQLCINTLGQLKGYRAHSQLFTFMLLRVNNICDFNAIFSTIFHHFTLFYVFFFHYVICMHYFSYLVVVFHRK